MTARVLAQDTTEDVKAELYFDTNMVFFAKLSQVSAAAKLSFIIIRAGFKGRHSGHVPRAPTF